MRYEAVIGLEIHAELNTKTKMFCYSPNDPDEKRPNVNICPICMAHPGTLPAINREAVKKVIMTGLALGGAIPEFSQFDRKNYFYPDLPKGYQISQYEHPLVQGGYLEITTHDTHNTTHEEKKKIRIRRIHLEEDTGRLIHIIGETGEEGDNRDWPNRRFRKPESYSLVDFNRAGVPLMELVTEPDLRTGEEVRAFGAELQKIIRAIGASDADMEKGQLRVEVNISLREIPNPIPDPIGDQITNKSQTLNSNDRNGNLGTKVEIKNINSFKFAADAVAYEIRRQTAVLERGEKIVQETRGWNERKGESFSQRVKEEAHDYRYFPEPDLPPLKITEEWVEEIRRETPELPAVKKERFIREYGLEQDMAEVLTRDRDLAMFFEAATSELAARDTETPEQPQLDLSRTLAAFITGDFLRLASAAKAPIASLRVTPENLAELVLYFAESKISNTAAKQVLEEMFRSGDDPSDIIDRLGLWQMSSAADMEDIATHIIKENPAAVADYKAGKSVSLQFLVGKMMKESRGTANPKIVQEIIKKILGEVA
ncbi:MAG: Asp-tRNA(Asn)/Glu-tRNA(Gln) amidotransferase subunit GatB [Patescibacteria group bacterium]